MVYSREEERRERVGFKHGLKPSVLPYAKRIFQNYVTEKSSTGSFHPRGKMALIQTKADYLKLIGFETEIDTKDKSYRGNVKDLSDNCEYIILFKTHSNKFINWILSFMKKEIKIPLKEINLVQIIDKKERGELQINGGKSK